MSLAYQPMTMVELAGHLSRQPDEKIRWKHVWEFLKEYRWEPADKQAQLLQAEPPTTGSVCVREERGSAQTLDRIVPRPAVLAPRSDPQSAARPAPIAP